MKTSNHSILHWLHDNIVPIIFAVLSLICIRVSGSNVSYVLSETMNRLTRNVVLILSLIMPILCGMGMNFSIVLGAMAGEVGLILITHWGIGGIQGIGIALVIATLVAIILGYLTGCLFNKVKGQEMITGMILGFFAVGVYDLIFLYMVGTIIPMNDPAIMLATTNPDGSTGYVGLVNTINLLDTTKYAVDNVWSEMFVPFLPKLIVFCAVVTVGIFGFKKFVKKAETKVAVKGALPLGITTVVLLILNILIKNNKEFYKAFFMVKVPVFTWIVIFLVCIMVIFITKTKLGQDIRTVGMDMHVAAAAGINVDKTRIVSTILSTVIASWGQILFLQNIGNIQTYNSHEQVGTYAIAAILVGGASIDHVNIKQVFIGCILFHVLYFTSPDAGRILFGDAALGEYFRVFLCYGIIAISLMLYARRKLREIRRRNEQESREQMAVQR